MSGAIVAASIGVAGAIGGAAISSHAAGKAADTQATAAQSAADLQYKASQDALGFQKQQYADSQANMQPWLDSGKGALSNLNNLMGIGPNPQAATGATPALPAGQAAPGATASTGARPTFGTGATLPAQGNQFGTPILDSSTGVRSTLQPGNISGLGAADPSNPTLSPGGSPVLTGGMQPSGGAQSMLAPIGTGTMTDPNEAPASGGYGSLMTPYSGSFTAPTDLTEQNDPGFQARLKLGTDAIQRSAAARGGVVTGGTAKALDTYGQDYASNEYGNVYNRALTDYTTKYNAYNNDQTNQYNRLASLSGLGQNTASQLATQGQNASNNVSSNLLNTAQQIGQQQNNAAYQTASGYVAQGNIYGGAVAGAGNSFSQLLKLQQQNAGNPYSTLYNAQNPTSYPSTTSVNLGGI